MAGLQWPVPVDTVKWVLKKEELQYEPNSEILFPVTSHLNKKWLVKCIKVFDN